MTREDIIRMAREAGFEELGSRADDWVCFGDEIERFAELVADAEREACAKVCDDWPNGRDDVYLIGKAIRARGQP